MVEALLDKAYNVHPYKRPVIGYEKISMFILQSDVQQFFDTHYVPSNLTKLRFEMSRSKIKTATQIMLFVISKPAQRELKVVEPAKSTREVSLHQPWYLEVPPSRINHPDNVVYEIIGATQ